MPKLRSLEEVFEVAAATAPADMAGDMPEVVRRRSHRGECLIVTWDCPVSDCCLRLRYHGGDVDYTVERPEYERLDIDVLRKQAELFHRAARLGDDLVRFAKHQEVH